MSTWRAKKQNHTFCQRQQKICGVQLYDIFECFLRFVGCRWLFVDPFFPVSFSHSVVAPANKWIYNFTRISCVILIIQGAYGKLFIYHFSSLGFVTRTMTTAVIHFSSELIIPSVVGTRLFMSKWGKKCV
jgi:hypothetical protein